MDKSFYLALGAGLLIYLGAVSGLYVVFKPNIEKSRKLRKERMEQLRKAKEEAQRTAQTMRDMEAAKEAGADSPPPEDDKNQQ